MPDQPLQPFAPPSVIFSHFPLALSSGVVLEYFLYFVFAFWAIYTLVIVYHWLKYSHASSIAFPAIGLHFVVSIALMSYALSGTFGL